MERAHTSRYLPVPLAQPRRLGPTCPKHYHRSSLASIPLRIRRRVRHSLQRQKRHSNLATKSEIHQRLTRGHSLRYRSRVNATTIATATDSRQHNSPRVPPGNPSAAVPTTSESYPANRYRFRGRQRQQQRPTNNCDSTIRGSIAIRGSISARANTTTEIQLRQSIRQPARQSANRQTSRQHCSNRSHSLRSPNQSPETQVFSSCPFQPCLCPRRIRSDQLAASSSSNPSVRRSKQKE